MENKDMARNQQGTDSEYDTRGQGMGETRRRTQDQEKKVIKISTRVPKLPAWLKLDHTMKLRIPIAKAKELANRLLEMDDDVDVQIRFASGETGGVNVRYEPLNVGQQDEGEKSGWGAGPDYTKAQRTGEMGSQKSQGNKESGWQPGVQTRSAAASGESSYRSGAMESGTEQTSQDSAEESMEEGGISTVTSVECTPYDSEEERQPG